MGAHMYSDTDTISHSGSARFFVQRSPPSDAAPWSHGTKVLLWISLVAASWAAVIFSGYALWSAL